METLLDGEAERLTRKAVERALDGDSTALRLCLERIAPPRRDRPITFQARPLAGPGDALRALADTFEAMAKGEVTSNEAAVIAGLLESYGRRWKTLELNQRVAALEASWPVSVVG